MRTRSCRHSNKGRKVKFWQKRRHFIKHKGLCYFSRQYSKDSLKQWIRIFTAQKHTGHVLFSWERPQGLGVYIWDIVRMWHIIVWMVNASQSKAATLFVSYFCQFSSLNEIHVSPVQQRLYYIYLEIRGNVFMTDFSLLNIPGFLFFSLKLRAISPLFTRNYQNINDRNHIGWYKCSEHSLRHKQTFFLGSLHLAKRPLAQQCLTTFRQWEKLRIFLSFNWFSRGSPTLGREEHGFIAGFLWISHWISLIKANPRLNFKSTSVYQSFKKILVEFEWNWQINWTRRSTKIHPQLHTSCCYFCSRDTADKNKKSMSSLCPWTL